MRAQIEEKRLQVLMASKRKEVEAEIQRQYQECTHRLSSERSQVQCALTALRERAFPPAPWKGSSAGAPGQGGIAMATWQGSIFYLPTALQVTVREELLQRAQGKGSSWLGMGM